VGAAPVEAYVAPDDAAAPDSAAGPKE